MGLCVCGLKFEFPWPLFDFVSICFCCNVWNWFSFGNWACNGQKLSFSHPAEVSDRKTINRNIWECCFLLFKLNLWRLASLTACKLGQFSMVYPLPKIPCRLYQSLYVFFFFWRRFIEVGTPFLTASSPGTRNICNIRIQMTLTALSCTGPHETVRFVSSSGEPVIML